MENRKTEGQQFLRNEDNRGIDNEAFLHESASKPEVSMRPRGVCFETMISIDLVYGAFVDINHRHIFICCCDLDFVQMVTLIYFLYLLRPFRFSRRNVFDANRLKECVQ